MATLYLLAAACILVRLIRPSAERIRKYRLRPLAIITLIAAAVTPTSDLLTDILLIVPLFVAYLTYDWVAARIRASGVTAV